MTPVNVDKALCAPFGNHGARDGWGLTPVDVNKNPLNKALAA